MKIPSPRSFIEFIAFFAFALCVMFGIILAVVLLAIFNGIERAVDGARNWRDGRRA